MGRDKGSRQTKNEINVLFSFSGPLDMTLGLESGGGYSKTILVKMITCGMMYEVNISMRIEK